VLIFTLNLQILFDNQILLAADCMTPWTIHWLMLSDSNQSMIDSPERHAKRRPGGQALNNRT
jgi:hypothetical protein